MKLNTKALKDVSYGFVTLSTGSYVAKINVAVKPNKSGTGNNLEVVHHVLDPNVINAKGESIQNSGNIRSTRWIGLQPNAEGTYDPDKVIKELGVAAGLDVDNEDVTTEQLEGKVVRVKIRYRAAEGQYPEGNEVMGWVPPTPGDEAIASASPF
jgi:hypothetical protein